MITIEDSYQYTDRGGRPDNQDACLILTADSFPGTRSTIGIQAVLDGVSSSNGKEASRQGLQAAYGPLAGLLASAMDLAEADRLTKESYIRQYLSEAVRRADSALRALPGDCASTISIAVVFDDMLYSCNLGDSPVLLVRHPDTEPEILACYEAHNEAGLQVSRGLMSAEEAAVSPLKNHLLYSLGGAEPWPADRIPFFSAPLDSNSLLLAGSDGALSVLTAARLASLVRGCRSMQQLTERLYEDVRAAGGEDNFTLMASRILVS